MSEEEGGRWWVVGSRDELRLIITELGEFSMFDVANTVAIASFENGCKLI
jgi:hypothetical protein